MSKWQLKADRIADAVREMNTTYAPVFYYAGGSHHELRPITATIFDTADEIAIRNGVSTYMLLLVAGYDKQKLMRLWV